MSINSLFDMYMELVIDLIWYRTRNIIKLKMITSFRMISGLALKSVILYIKVLS